MPDFQFQLRPAKISDAELLYNWRNDPLTRQFSHHQEEIDFNAHYAWLKNSLHNENRKIHIVYIDIEPVGTVREDFSDGITELSWTVNPDFRGKGIGEAMVSFVANRIKNPIKAEVKESNTASKRIAEACGMRLEKTQNKVMFFYRDAKLSQE